MLSEFLLGEVVPALVEEQGAPCSPALGCLGHSFNHGRTASYSPAWLA